MKKLLTVVAAGAAGSLLISATPTAAAPPPRTVQIYVTAGEPAHVDELEPGMGPGDWLLFRDPVVDADGGEIGTAVTRVQVIAPTREGDIAFVLDCTIELEDGGLVFTGAELFSRLESEVHYAIVGGTGEYVGIEGQVVGRPAVVNGGPVSEITFELVRK